jgi:DNA-binding transcriptional ArsR family regulator
MTAVVPEVERVELSDPRAIRALAHPARLLVIDALYDQGIELTATQAAALAGITPSAMSYHLRALERFGIARRAAEGGDARERPWVRAGRTLAIRPTAVAPSTAGVAATSAVLAMSMDLMREKLLGAVQRVAGGGQRLPLDTATGFATTSLLVTAEEATTLLKTIEDAIEPLRLENRVDPPPSAGRLTLTIVGVPDPDHPGAHADRDEEG